MKWYLHVLKNYANFNGRARRKEYWMYTLFCIIFCVIAAVIDTLLGITFKITVMGMTKDLHYGYVYLAYALAVFLPGFAVGVRRLHDVGKSGWLLGSLFLLGLVLTVAAFKQLYLITLLLDLPLLGLSIWILVLLVMEGTPGDNKYGPDPKKVPEPA